MCVCVLECSLAAFAVSARVAETRTHIYGCFARACWAAGSGGWLTGWLGYSSAFMQTLSCTQKCACTRIQDAERTFLLYCSICSLDRMHTCDARLTASHCNDALRSARRRHKNTTRSRRKNTHKTSASLLHRCAVLAMRSARERARPRGAVIAHPPHQSRAYAHIICVRACSRACVHELNTFKLR